MTDEQLRPMTLTRGCLFASLSLIVASLGQLAWLPESGWESATLVVCVGVSLVCGAYFWRSR